MNTEDPKETAFYAALVDAWLTTRMEKDRTLLALSAGGVGLLVTLLTTSGVQSNCHMALYILATASFLVAIGSCIWILHRNAVYLEKEVFAHSEKKPTSDDRCLVLLDRTLISAFIVGVVLSISVAVMSAWPNKGDDEMSNRKDINIKIERLSRQPNDLTKSLTGVGKLRPDAAAALGNAQKQPATGGGKQGGTDSKPSGTSPSAAKKAKQ